MASKRLNVLVYNGPGATHNSLRHALFTLRRLLTPAYAVLPLSTAALLNEPWQPTCALLVMPGGADVPYCNALNGAGNARIRAYVEHGGGAYLGLCAGGYYASGRCEFEAGRGGAMEVVGDRELAFFPGTCRGCAFPGFKYDSEAGARAAEVKVEKAAFGSGGRVPESLRVYYNGGGVFVDADEFKEKGVEVLARFTEDVAVEPGKSASPHGGPAAMVYCRVGNGGALLTSPHPEFSGPNLEVMHNTADEHIWPKTVESLKRDEQLRTDLMKACLVKLGLRVSSDADGAPSLSKLYLSSQEPAEASSLMGALGDIITQENGKNYIKDENDTFVLEKASPLSMAGLRQDLPGVASGDGASDEIGEISVDEGQSSVGPGKETKETKEDQIVDFAAIVKEVVVHRAGYPSPKETPYFNHKAFFSNLMQYYSQIRDANPVFGKNMLYGEVVTSTNTMLEKNTQLLRRLPHGFTFTATVQVAGRGRGSNVWVSPAGSLMFSTVIRHEVELQSRAPVVFIQYLAAMAVVDAVRTYDRGYDAVEVRLKWPNDIYAVDPAAAAGDAKGAQRYTKIGGILVNSHYSDTTYHSVLGLGLNLANALPTTSLNNLLAHKHPRLAPFTTEKLLARILCSFSALYTRFRRTGFDEYLEDKYYAAWLHTGQIVTLETEVGKRARICGITSDWGLLVAEEVDEEGRGYGRKIELQSDSNSFDFFKGLVRRKV